MKSLDFGRNRVGNFEAASSPLVKYAASTRRRQSESSVVNCR